MPVLNKDEHRRIMKELNSRASYLLDKMQERPLLNASEGLVRGQWGNPDNKCATLGSAGELRLAVEDFKNILAEIRRLK